jgi:2-isopropylmalate synthase
MYVTEDTTRADPDTLRALYSTAIRAGATRVCVADTVGHATPHGSAAVVKFVATVVEECAAAESGSTGTDIRDRDFAIINTLAALEAGATRLHGAAIGIGERVGNTPMELLMMNLVLMGYIERDLSALCEYCDAVSRGDRRADPANYPVVGRDAFRTATGVHAAAVIKAFRKNDRADRRRLFRRARQPDRREQQIDVGPMSGKSNVVFWLERRGVTATEALVDRIFQRAKASATVLTESEVLDEIKSAQPS